MRVWGVRARSVLALLLLLAAVLMLYQLAGMDARLLPRSSFGLAGLARYLIGDYRGAAAAYRAHLKRVAGAQRENLDPAWAALLEERLDDAQARADEQLKRGSSIDALLTLTEVALRRNEPQRALEFARRVFQQDENNYDGRLLAAVALARLREYSAAVDSMTRALRQDRVERRLTSFFTIMESAGELAARPDKEGQCLLAHYHRYLRIFDRSQGAVAIRHARRAIAARDRPDAAWHTIAVVSWKQDRRDDAVDALQEAIRANPRNSEALRWLAQHHSDRGDLVNELQLVKAAFEASPGDAFYAVQLHFVLTEKLGDHRQALDLYRADLTARPDDAVLWGKIGEVLYQLGNYPEALDAHTRAAALAPANPDHLVHQGWALMAMDQDARALSILEKAVVLGPAAAEPYYVLGTAYSRLRRFDEATATIERSFALAPPTDANRLVLLCGLYRRARAYERTYTCLKTALRMDSKNQLALRWMVDAELNVARGSR